MRSWTFGAALFVVVSPACGGLVYDESAPRAACGVEQPIATSNDSCRPAVIACNGPSDYNCYTYENTKDLYFTSTTGMPMMSLADGALHLHTTVRENISNSISCKVPDSFEFEGRFKTAPTTNGVIIVQGRIPLRFGVESTISLRVIDSEIRMCSPGIVGHPDICVALGPFGPDVWHTLKWTLKDGHVTGAVDCGQPISVAVSWPAPLNPTFVCSVEYGIVESDCIADVNIDLARAE